MGREEIVGIEHFIFELSPKLINKARQMHSHSILLEQEKQKITGLRDEGGFALVSECASKRSMFQARVRASIQHEQMEA